MKIDLNNVEETLLIPLWGRAQLSREHNSLLNDAKALEIIEQIDYDFSKLDRRSVFRRDLWFVIRAKQFDDKIKAYVADHPRASIVNIGAGLDTTFYRVDNGSIHWYDLDLPNVIDIRKQLLPEPDRVTYIAKSLLDPSWCGDVKHTEDGVLMVAGGVFGWLEESQVKQFFSMLADNFPGGEIVFNARSKLDNNFEAWVNQFPPEQRDAMKAALMEALKDWWEKAPQDQKDKLNDTTATLKAPTKPKGKKWADFEAWWNELSTKEKEEAWRNFRVFPFAGSDRWALADVNEFTKWDKRITVIDHFPMFKNIPRDSLSTEMRQFMDYSDKSGRSNIFHLRV